MIVVGIRKMIKRSEPYLVKNPENRDNPPIPSNIIATIRKNGAKIIL